MLSKYFEMEEFRFLTFLFSTVCIIDEIYRSVQLQLPPLRTHVRQEFAGQKIDFVVNERSNSHLV